MLVGMTWYSHAFLVYFKPANRSHSLCGLSVLFDLYLAQMGFK